MNRRGGMGAGDYARLQNSKKQTNWAGGLLLCFGVAVGGYHLDKQTNFVNWTSARLTNSQMSKVPFAYKVDQAADRAYNFAVQTFK